MISQCSGDSRVSADCSRSLRFFSCNATSGSFAVSATVALAPRWQRHGIDCGEQPLDRARRWRTECLIQVDRLDKLLADQIILPRQFAVVGQRSLHAINVAATQRTDRVPGQQSFYLLRLQLFVY